MNNHRLRYKWELLLILWAAYFLYQGGLQIYGAVLPLIKAGLTVSDVRLGMAVTVYSLIYGLTAPVGGCLGDFFSKKWLVSLSVLTFSVGILLTGLSSGFLT